MWKKLNTAPYYVCGYGDVPKWINSPWLLPSYANLSKCLNTSFYPSMNIVNKIVQFYNANITPAIDVYVFLHEKLEMRDTNNSAGEGDKLKDYLGLYYGYYYAGIEDEAHIYGALIRLCQEGGSVTAYMIAGLSDDEMLMDSQIEQIIMKCNGDLKDYKAFKKNLPLSKRRITIYKGAVTYIPGLMTLSLKDIENDNTYLQLKIPTFKTVGDKYIGSLSVITMISADYHIQFLKVGLVRANDEELNPLKLDSDKLFELLKIKKAVNEHVYLAVADNDRWIDYLIDCAGE